MNHQEITVGVGGAAQDGQGKTAVNLATMCSRLGLHLFTYTSYQSVIMGGHIWLRVRISEEKIKNHGDRLDIAIALNQDCADRHAVEVDPGGAIIFNGDKIQVDPEGLKAGVRVYALPVSEIMAPFGRQPAIMQNTIALGAALWLAQLELEGLAEVIRETFAHKGQEVIDTNIALAQAGYDWAKRQGPSMDYEWNYSRKKRMFLTGNESFSLGALAAGCKFYAAYPMTPASSILDFMANHAKEYGVVVKQAEDEIAVINMAVGAGHAGVRAMVGTSGGGFSLMTEGVGLAGMTETPIVIIEVQRGGPSTGLPTKTEQGDLNQVLGASQGEYPRMIVAPTDIVDCFHTIAEAFNIAERYQCPVIVVSDLYLSEHYETAEPEAFDFDVPIDRGEVVSDAENGEYKRYLYTESGVSPRALPGGEGTIFVAASDEHDERGILISDVFTDPVIRKQMMEKRMSKMNGIFEELEPPKLYGHPNADLTLVGWGSTTGVIREAIERLEEDGINANNLQIKYLVPFHATEVGNILNASEKVIVVENNYNGQLARHIRAETGIAADGKILKYDGEPFEPVHIIEQVKEALNGSGS